MNSGTTPQCSSTCPATRNPSGAATYLVPFLLVLGPKEIGIFVNLVLHGLALMRAGGEELPSLVLMLLRDAIGPDPARTPARRSA